MITELAIEKNKRYFSANYKGQHILFGFWEWEDETKKDLNEIEVGLVIRRKGEKHN